MDEITFMREMDAPQGALLHQMPAKAATAAIEFLTDRLGKMAKDETDKKAATTNFAEELGDAIPNF